MVHPAPGNLDGTLVNALLAHCGPGFTGIGAERRPGIVHRLDKDTSGVMVVAKTQLANDALTAAFAARDLDRAYLALVWGLPQPTAGEIEGAIGRDKRDRKRMAVVDHGGKFALTRYRTMRAWQTSLVTAGMPAGDRAAPIRSAFTYRRRAPDRRRSGVPPPRPGGGQGHALPLRSQLLDFPRQALHAASLGLQAPKNGQAISFEAALPADMHAIVGGRRQGHVPSR